MAYEVELKFPIDNPDDIERQLADLGAKRETILEQCDVYYSHPLRDFSQTDEALRIRTSGDKNFVTYKGPLLDAATKTRREIEIPFAPGDQQAERFGQLLAELGFSAVREVRKTRVPYLLQWEDRTLEIVVDDVAGLETFLEIECLADEPDLDAVRDSVLRLAEQLELKNSERRSYLQLLLEQEVD